MKGFGKFKPVAQPKPLKQELDKTKQPKRNIVKQEFKKENDLSRRRSFKRLIKVNSEPQNNNKNEKIVIKEEVKEDINMNLNEIISESTPVSLQDLQPKQFIDPLSVPFLNGNFFIEDNGCKLFQFPSVIPKQKGLTIKPEISQDTPVIKQPNQLPNVFKSCGYTSGKIGKIKKYKNGKMKLFVGDTVFIMNKSSPSSFKETVCQINNQEIKSFDTVCEHYIASPKLS